MRGGLSIFSFKLLFLSLPVCICLVASPARAVDLPEKAPIPAARDEGTAAEAEKDDKQKGQEELPQEAPIPQERPREKPSDAAPTAKEGSTQEPAANSDSQEDEAAEGKPSAPEDEADKSARSDEQAEPEEEKKPAEPGEDGERTVEPAKEPDIPPPLSPAGQLCRSNLRSLGVAFTEDDPVDRDEGCAIPHPLSITTLSKEIAIEPTAELNCMMAETFAAFVQDVVQPAAERHFGQTVKAVLHASAFVCRPRNGTKTLSEHAFGNALDIAAFILADDSEVAVKAYDPEDHASLDKAQFLNEVRAAACGPFTTVLGPGSNADHATHFHFDLKERNDRYKVCE